MPTTPGTASGMLLLVSLLALGCSDAGADGQTDAGADGGTGGEPSSEMPGPDGGSVPGPEPELGTPHEVLHDDESYDDFVAAITGTEILRYELSTGTLPPRVAVAAALVMAFAERNPMATEAQLKTFATEVHAELLEAFPGDPDLARPTSLLPAARFAASRISSSALAGCDVHVGSDALLLLELDLDTSSRSLRAVDFEHAQAVVLEDHPPLARLITWLLLDRATTGSPRPGLRAALLGLLAEQDVDLAPPDLAESYPEVARARAALPPDYAAYLSARSDSFAALQSVIEEELSAISGRIDESLDAIAAELGDEPDPFAAPLSATDPAAMAAIQRFAKNASARAEGRAKLSMSTSLMEQSGADVPSQHAQRVQVFSAMQLQTDESMSTLLAALEIGGLGLVSLGELRSGNIAGGIGALMFATNGVLTLAGADPLSADEQIFDQIIALREQVQQLRSEMHERFDVIDEKLDVIYGALINGLEDLDRVDRNLRQVSVDLYVLRTSLSRLEANLYGVLSSGFEQAFVEDMEAALGYQERTGTALEFAGAGDNAFVGFHSRFVARATTVALDAVYAGPQSSTLSNDASANAALTEFPLGYNINNLREFPSRLGLPRWSDGRVANPTTWSLAADAYAQLARENPWYFARLHQGAPEDLDRVIGVGESVREMMRGARNRELLETLVAEYLARLDALHERLDLALYLERNGHPRGFDPFVEITDGMDMRGMGPAIDDVLYNASSVTADFDTTVVWERINHLNGLAAALNMPEWEADRYQLRYRIQEDPAQSIASSTHYVELSVSRSVDETLTPGSALLRAHFSFVGDAPAMLESWLSENTTLLEWLFRASDEGETFEAGGYTVEYGLSFLRNDGSFPLPAPDAEMVESALQRLGDDYWTHADNELKSSPGLELVGSLAASQSLLDAYISLGLPETLEANDFVRAVLRGAPSQRSGLGGQWLAEAFEAARVDRTNPPDFAAPLRARAERLLEELRPALEAERPEAHPYLEWSLASLKDIALPASRLCTDDTYVTQEEQELVVDASEGLLANDARRPDPIPVEASLVSPPERGSVTLGEDGSFRYTPAPGFTGEDSFRYSASVDLAQPGAPPNEVTADPATVVVRVESMGTGAASGR